MRSQILNIGQALKERRESKKISLQTIADQTKIRPGLLSAIEEGRTDPFPAHTYLRGFILAYAKALGIKEEEIAKELKALSPSEDNVHLSDVAGSSAGSAGAENIVEKDLRLTPIILAILILFILGSILVLSNVLRSHKEQSLDSLAEKSHSTHTNQITIKKDSAQSQKELSTKDDKAEPAIKSQKPRTSVEDEKIEKPRKPTKPATVSATAGGTTSSTASVKTKPNVVSDKKAPLVAKPAKKEESFRPLPEEGGETPQRQPAKTAPAEKAPVQQGSLEQDAKELEIIVQAIKETEVQYQVDGAKRQSAKLAQDQFKVLKAKGEILIKAGQSDLIYIFKNGKDLGLFGTGGTKEKVFYINNNQKNRKDKE